ncbi:MAG: hypothetical protein ABI652_05215 [Acidobacteriota bacterium]
MTAHPNATHRASRIPIATYRLQLHREFTCLDLERVVPQLLHATVLT